MTFFLFALTLMTATIAAMSPPGYYHAPPKEGPGPSALITLVLLCVIELFVVSLIGWTIAFWIWIGLTVGVTMVLVFAIDICRCIAAKAGVDRDILGTICDLACPVMPVLAAVGTLSILAMAAGAPPTHIFDGLAWLAGLFTPGIIGFALIIAVSAWLYHEIVDHSSIEDDET